MAPLHQDSHPPVTVVSTPPSDADSHSLHYVAEAEQETEIKIQSELRDIKDTLHKQRAEIRGLQRELTSRTVDLEAVSGC